MAPGVFRRYLGAERADDPRLRDISPRRAAGNGYAPVLLIHGRDDLVVPYSHSTAMESALREAGRPVELVTLWAEDHWLSREPTRIQTMQAVVTFLEQHNPPDRPCKHGQSDHRCSRVEVFSERPRAFDHMRCSQDATD